MRKVSIIGAGNVGATAAMKIASNKIADKIVLLDIKEGVAEGKAMDIMQCTLAEDFSVDIIGITNDYSATIDSDIIVVTSGMARKPGMTREDLVGVNSRIMNSVITECDKYSPNACYVIVSNPMDTMTMQALNILRKLHPNQNMDTSVIGMGNLLDSSRFRYFIYKKLKEVKPEVILSINDIVNSWVVGGHGDKTMIPLPERVIVHTTWGMKYPLDELLKKEEIEDIVNNTMRGGSILTNLLGTSAWEAPGACIAKTVKYLFNRSLESIPCSVYRKEYECCVGTLTYLGPSRDHYGFDAVIPEDTDDLIKKMKNSVESIKEVNKAIPEI